MIAKVMYGPDTSNVQPINNVVFNQDLGRYEGQTLDMYTQRPIIVHATVVKGPYYIPVKENQ